MAQGIREQGGILPAVRSAMLRSWVGKLSHGDKELSLHVPFQSAVPYVLRDAYNRYPGKRIRPLGISPIARNACPARLRRRNAWRTPG